MKKHLPLWALLPLLIAAGCSEDNSEQDTTAPEITSAIINGRAENAIVETSQPMFLEAVVSDNSQLQELKIDIHDNFDGHGHGKTSNTWETVLIWPLSGSNYTTSDSIFVPGQATAGLYHATLRALDQEGNESEFVELDFILRNGLEPEISINQPDFGNEVSVQKGDTITLAGSITDESDLVEVFIVAEEEHEEHSHKKRSGLIYEKDFDLPGSSDTNFELSQVQIAIPANAEAGHYRLEIVALDQSGNYGVSRAEFEILP